MRKILIIIFALVLTPNIVFGATFSTWDTLELDTCASAWLIKRFVDTEAKFKFYPKGEFISEGTPFNTPDSELKRTNNMSTFEKVMDVYQIDDPKLLTIGKMLHELEVNYWAGEPSAKANHLNEEVLEIINRPLSNEENLKETFKVMDLLYKKIGADK